MIETLKDTINRYGSKPLGEMVVDPLKNKASSMLTKPITTDTPVGKIQVSAPTTLGNTLKSIGGVAKKSNLGLNTVDAISNAGQDIGATLASKQDVLTKGAALAESAGNLAVGGLADMTLGRAPFLKSILGNTIYNAATGGRPITELSKMITGDSPITRVQNEFNGTTQVQPQGLLTPKIVEPNVAPANVNPPSSVAPASDVAPTSLAPTMVALPPGTATQQTSNTQVSDGFDGIRKQLLEAKMAQDAVKNPLKQETNFKIKQTSNPLEAAMQLQQAVALAIPQAVNNKFNKEKAKAILSQADSEVNLKAQERKAGIDDATLAKTKVDTEKDQFELNVAKQKDALLKEYLNLDENAVADPKAKAQIAERKAKIAKLLGISKMKTEVIKGGVDSQTGQILPDRVVQYDDAGNVRFLKDETPQQPTIPDVKNGDVKLINGIPMKFDENLGWVKP